MGNTVPEKESIEHCSYTVMFTILSGFMGIKFTTEGKDDESIPACRGSRQISNRLGPLAAVQGAVLDRLAQMLKGDVFGCFQVGYGTRHFQDVVVGAGRKPQPGDGIFQ